MTIMRWYWFNLLTKESLFPPSSFDYFKSRIILIRPWFFRKFRMSLCYLLLSSVWVANPWGLLKEFASYFKRWCVSCTQAHTKTNTCLERTIDVCINQSLLYYIFFLVVPLESIFAYFSLTCQIISIYYHIAWFRYHLRSHLLVGS